MSRYVKDMIGSATWRLASDRVRVAWATLYGLANERGVVEGVSLSLSRALQVSENYAQVSIEVLEDLRIIELNGTSAVIKNFSSMDPDEHRKKYFREAQRRYRSKLKARAEETAGPLPPQEGA